MTKTQKVPITERALIQRINRKLEPEGERLCTARTEAAKEQLGRFYVVETGQHAQPKNYTSQGVVYTDLDLEKFARKLGVIEPWEELEATN